MKRWGVVAVFLIVVTGCGGGSDNSGPRTFEELGTWLKDAGECESVEMQLTHLPVPPSRPGEANERFNSEAMTAGSIVCGGLNGYIAYYRFPSAEARATAVRGREGLISNELFCAKGSELVVNDLLGYDRTVGFCKKLGFPIHRPTHEFSPAQRREHFLEARAASLVRHLTDEPNLWCEHSGGRLRFECVEPVGGEITEIELVRKGHRFVIKGCEDLGAQRTKKGFRGETCSFPSHAR
jgi:hypothetical protein